MGKTEGLIWPGGHGSGEVELSPCHEVKFAVFAVIGGVMEKLNFLIVCWVLTLTQNGFL